MSASAKPINEQRLNALQTCAILQRVQRCEVGEAECGADVEVHVGGEHDQLIRGCDALLRETARATHTRHPVPDGESAHVCSELLDDAAHLRAGRERQRRFDLIQPFDHDNDRVLREASAFSSRVGGSPLVIGNWWRRRELNPRPKTVAAWLLHA